LTLLLLRSSLLLLRSSTAAATQQPAAAQQQHRPLARTNIVTNKHPGTTTRLTLSERDATDDTLCQRHDR